MIPIIIVLGVLILFSLIALILVNFNGQNLLVSLFNMAKILPINLQKGIDILNSLIEKDIKIEFIFSLVNVVVFIIFSIIFFILTQKSENNCNILSLFYVTIKFSSKKVISTEFHSLNFLTMVISSRR